MTLRATWERLKVAMAPGVLDPLVKEMIYIAVSIANGCAYCVQSHTASARAKGLSDAQYAELLGIIGLAMQTNGLVTALQVPVDETFGACDGAGASRGGIILINIIRCLAFACER